MNQKNSILKNADTVIPKAFTNGIVAECFTPQVVNIGSINPEGRGFSHERFFRLQFTIFYCY